MSNSRAIAPIPFTNPEVPLTLEGYAVLHQIWGVDWSGWKALPADRRGQIATEARQTIAALEATGQTALYALFGHKGDLMLLHFRRGFEELIVAELALRSLALGSWLRPATSFLSVIELSLYESSVKVYEDLRRRGVEPGSEEWTRALAETLDRQSKAMAPRLWPEVPGFKYICFYPMNRRRAPSQNWYETPIAERRRMMHEHGESGRKYAGKVQQIITGAIGLDDWEWGVDLFADDPRLFKQLVYEMRFDEASARYAEFGPFYVGLRLASESLPDYLEGRWSPE